VGELVSDTLDQPVRVDAAANQPLLAFVHIPRTGGGTVSSAISKNYSPMKGPGNYQKSPDKTRSGLARIAAEPGYWEAVGDHVPYGLYLQYLPAETRYITILRDPVDRVLSHYHFHAQAGEPPGTAGARKLKRVWEELLDNERSELEGGEEAETVLPEDAEFSLEEGLRRKIPIYDNFMTRFLWGGESLFGELPPDALERAKANIASFFFVGVRERLDESIILLGRKLGAGPMPYYLRHVSWRRPQLGETSPELRELVGEHNALDVELYRFARERFEETAPAPGELADEIEQLRARSAEITEEGEARRLARKAGKGVRRGRTPGGRDTVEVTLPADGDLRETLAAVIAKMESLTERLAQLESQVAAVTGKGTNRSLQRADRASRRRSRRGAAGDPSPPEGEALDG
jgi:hypothetical protein